MPGGFDSRFACKIIKSDMSKKTEKKETRKKKYRGFDFYEDQLEEIERLSNVTGYTQAAIIRSMADKFLKLPRQ